SVTVQNADTTPPTATLSAPASGTTVSGVTSVNVSGTDNVGVTKVEWYLDAALVGSSAAASASFSWDTTTAVNGSHSLQGKAYDGVGNSGASASITVTVKNVVQDTTPPIATLGSPSAGSTVSGTATVSVSGTDNVGVAKVEWYLDAVLAGSSASASG